MLRQVLKQIYILPLALYLFASFFFVCTNPISASAAVLLANSLFAALLICHPGAFCQCESISFMLLCSRIVKEILGIELPSEIETDGFNELFTYFSVWIFEAAFWILVLMLAIIILFQLANTLGDSEMDTGASSPGLPSAKLIELPILEFSEYQQKNQSCIENECSICLETFEFQDKINTLHNCQHVYHPECLNKWLVQHKNCPYCRAEIYKKDSALSIDDEDEEVEPTEGNNNDLNDFIAATGMNFSLLPTI